jgi:hypothetical protein
MFKYVKIDLYFQYMKIYYIRSFVSFNKMDYDDYGQFVILDDDYEDNYSDVNHIYYNYNQSLFNTIPDNYFNITDFKLFSLQTITNIKNICISLLLFNYVFNNKNCTYF